MSLLWFCAAVSRRLSSRSALQPAFALAWLTSSSTLAEPDAVAFVLGARTVVLTGWVVVVVGGAAVVVVLVAAGVVVAVGVLALGLGPPFVGRSVGRSVVAVLGAPMATPTCCPVLGAGAAAPPSRTEASAVGPTARDATAVPTAPRVSPTSIPLTVEDGVRRGLTAPDRTTNG
ncbi:hypothetical protein GCM10010174_62140 [Kutzneria viridogrisea]